MLENFATRFVGASAEVAVAMVIAADTLFVEIPEEFDSAMREDGSFDDADIGFVRRGANFGRGKIGFGVADTVGLACRKSGGEFVVGFLDEFDRGAPVVGDLL